MIPRLDRTACLGEALRDSVLAYKSNLALAEADRHAETRQLTYLELKRAAERIAARMQARGFAAGDRAAVLMSNQSRWAEGALGALWAGGILVPLDYKLTGAEQAALLERARPAVLLTEYAVYRDLIEEAPSLLSEMQVIVAHGPEDGRLAHAEAWDLAFEGPFTYVGRQRDDVASIVYSSGTGGTPKGCQLTHDSYLVQAEVLGGMFPMEEDEVYFSVLPTNHAIDFMCGMVIPYLFGASVVHQRTLRPEFIASTMKRYRVTHTALVPRILKSLRERIEEQLQALPEWKRTLVASLMDVNEVATLKRPNARLSRALLRPIHERFGGRLRVIVAGGAFIEPDLADFFNRIGLPVAIGYGLTEACAVLTVNDLSPYRASTVGRPVEGVELELRDVGQAGVGEVYARGRSIMAGYLDEPQLTAEALVDGWLRTGDLGRLDASGHLQLVGRAKNMIVTEGGKNIYPEDIEGAFDAVTCEELCVFSERFVWPSDGLGGERLLVVVRLKPGQAASDMLASLHEQNKRLADYKRVGAVLIWDEEFPRTASMKVKRAALAHALRQQSERPSPL